MDNPFVPGENQGAAAGLRAVILAGGKDARLLPLTVNSPKPLVPLGNTPVLLDIGRPDDYARAQELYAEKQELIDRI